MSSSQLVIEHLRALAAPRRNNYFYGKRLDVPHFRMEQDYGKEKQWLLNRLSLGKGVLCGLDVTAQQGQVCVSPGVAIDGLGREIIFRCRAAWTPGHRSRCAVARTRSRRRSTAARPGS